MAVPSIPRTAAHVRSDFVVSPDSDSGFFTDFFTGRYRHGEHVYCLYAMGMDPDTSCSFEVLAY